MCYCFRCFATLKVAITCVNAFVALQLWKFHRFALLLRNLENNHHMCYLENNHHMCYLENNHHMCYLENNHHMCYFENNHHMCYLENNHHMCYCFLFITLQPWRWGRDKNTQYWPTALKTSAISLSLGLQVLLGLGAHSPGTGPGFNLANSSRYKHTMIKPYLLAGLQLIKNSFNTSRHYRQNLYLTCKP